LPKNRPEHIGAIIGQMLRESHGETYVKSSEAILRWREIVGEQIARQAQPESLKNGVLLVLVQNSVWLSQLRFMAEELQKKLNRELASHEIKEIHFRQGQLDPDIILPPSAKSRRVGRPRSHRAPPSLTPEQQGLLADVADREIRQALENLLKKQAEFVRT
jgi:hypothetical protein